MARKNQDASSVSFKAEILFDGKPYSKPLFLITEEEDYAVALSAWLSSGDCYAVSMRVVNTIKHIRSLYRNMKPVSYQTWKDFLQSGECETELKHFCYVSDEINAMRALYYTCLDKADPDCPDIETVFQILYQVKRYYDSISLNVKSMWSFAQSKDMIAQWSSFMEREIRYHMRGFIDFKYICDIFCDFIETNIEEINNYEYIFRQHHTDKYVRSYVNFWKNRAFSMELRELFWNYCRQMPDSQIKAMLFKRDVSALKKYVLDLLDRQLQRHLEGSRPSICTKDGSLTWNATSLESAEYLCLFSDLIKKKKYRVCTICGAIFEVDPRYQAKIYCSMHTPSQIQYFNRKRKKQRVD